MVDKHFVDLNTYYQDSLLLAKKVIESKFYPNYLVALWRGGTFPGMSIQEFFKKIGLKVDHISIRTNHYDDSALDKRQEKVLVIGLNYLIDNANSEDKILIVDDVFDTGKTIREVIDQYTLKTRKNAANIKIATVYYKPSRNETNIKPDYYIHETDQWIVFPHELIGLTNEEIEKGKGKKTLDLIAETEKLLKK